MSQPKKQRKPGSGGARPGAGVKPRFPGEPLKRITVMCPDSKVTELKQIIKTTLEQWKMKE